MAETTQATQKSLLRSTISVDKIQKSVSSFGKSLNSAQKTSLKINTTLSNSNKSKRESLAQDRISFQRRREAVRRREQEDIVEASGIGGAIKRQGKVIASSTKGFLGRILDFIGTLLVGWMINNLPMIINLAQQLIGRIQKLVGVLGGFVQNTINILSGFGTLLSGVFSSLITFDFSDQNQQITRGLNQMQMGFMGVEQNFNQAINLLTEPLDLGFDELEFPNIPNQEEDTGEPSPPGTSGTAGQLQPIHKQALDIISGPESGGDYNAMNNGQAGDRLGGSKRWLGKNLTDMTIGEVKQYQNVKKTLWAAGRYQIVPGSLPSAQAAAGLKDSDRFDQNNQDLLAIGLLKSQGPGAWTKYSKYSQKEIDIMYKAKDTPLGPATPRPPSTSSGPAVTTSVIDQLDVARNKSPLGGITDTFGYSASRGRMHDGIDIGTYNTPGFYVAFKGSGKVVFSGVSGGYGNLVIIKSGNTEYYFAHLAKRMVRQGDVYRGQTIGEIGTTGRSTGIHLHFEVRPNGRPIDPRPYLGYLSIGKKLTGVAGLPSGAEVRATPEQIQAAKAGTPESVSQQITTERKGQLVLMTLPSSQMAPQATMPQGGGGVSIPSSDEIPLNRMIAQKLLLDLAYT